MPFENPVENGQSPQVEIPLTFQDVLIFFIILFFRPHVLKTLVG